MHSRFQGLQSRQRTRAGQSKKVFKISDDHLLYNIKIDIKSCYSYSGTFEIKWSYKVVGYQQNAQFYQRFHLIKIKVFEPIVESTGSMNRISIRWKHVGTGNVGSSL